MKIYFKILKNIMPTLKQEDIYTPIKDTGIDSLGFLAIRVEIEKHLGFEIPDNEWIRFECFNDLINFCESKSKSVVKAKVKLNDLKTKRSYSINLPQMANYALSENWLFKELGDLHWQLLCNGLHTKSALLKDEDENRLYATFIHIQIKCSSLRSFKENNQFDFDAKIMRYGQNNYLSEIKGVSDSRKIDAKLMTTFSKREGPDNLELIKCHPIVKTNSIPTIEKIPHFLTDYRLIKKALKDKHDFNDASFNTNAKSVFEIRYELNPYYDLNGVGLLYFAAYPTISDYCESKYFNQLNHILRWENEYFTIARDIYYFANCNIDDKIVYHLNEYEFYQNNKVKISCSLYRESDKTLMAHIFTIKEKHGQART